MVTNDSMEWQTLLGPTSKQKLSSHSHLSSGSILPSQGDWWIASLAETVMSDTAGLDMAKGTLIHWDGRKDTGGKY